MPPVQRTFTYTQKIKGVPQEIFPLLCPNRETEWLDSWKYEMIYSESGYAEENCVFKTPDGNTGTYWIVSRYDPLNLVIEFVHFTLPEVIVKISIQVCDVNKGITPVKIAYTYTALNDKKREFIKNQLPYDFKESMIWWERSMNHYLETHKMLKR